MATSPEQTVGVGLYGLNGHQVHDKLRDHRAARLVCAAGAGNGAWPEWLQRRAGVRRCQRLDDLLDDTSVQLVCLCSPSRREQVADALRCIESGRHVYAEKPCAFSEADLDRLIDASKRRGVVFREMNDTLYTPPFHGIRRRVLGGAVGRVVQVVAQKSYPLMGKPRPTDDDTDGGLLRQVGVHAVRMVEHIAGQRVRDDADAVHAIETSFDYPAGGRIVGATTFLLALDSGGSAAAVCNYLNPDRFPSWGNESVRVFGLDGMIEAVDAGTRTRWVTAERDEPWQEDELPIDPFDAVVDEVLGVPGELLPLEEDLHPTRVVLRAFDRLRGRA